MAINIWLSVLTSVTPKVLIAPAFHVTTPVLDDAEPEKR